MRTDNSRFIIEAAKQRRDAALRRTYEALDRLDETGQVTFAAVAAAASVSRAWLYRQPLIRAEIDRLRVAHAQSRILRHPSSAGIRRVAAPAHRGAARGQQVTA